VDPEGVATVQRRTGLALATGEAQARPTWAMPPCHSLNSSYRQLMDVQFLFYAFSFHTNLQNYFLYSLYSILEMSI